MADAQSQPRCYVPVDPRAVTPEMRPLMVGEPTPLPDVRVLLKIRRALVPLSADADGCLVRELPPEVAALGVEPIGSAAAAALLDSRDPSAVPAEIAPDAVLVRDQPELWMALCEALEAEPELDKAAALVSARAEVGGKGIDLEVAL